MLKAQVVRRLLKLAAIVIALVLATGSAQPSTSGGDCEARVAELQVAMQVSPLVMTDDAEEALRAALEACYGSSTESEAAIGGGGGGGPAEAKVMVRGGSPARVVCRSGQVTGLGPLTVIIAAPPAPSQNYQEVALMHYSFVSPSTETFSARAPDGMGFDVSVVGETGWGTLYVAGVPFPADEISVGGACSRPNSPPCEASGLAGLTSNPLLEVWMFGALQVCL